MRSLRAAQNTLAVRLSALHDTLGERVRAVISSTAVTGVILGRRDTPFDECWSGYATQLAIGVKGWALVSLCFSLQTERHGLELGEAFGVEG